MKRALFVSPDKNNSNSQLYEKANSKALDGQNQEKTSLNLQEKFKKSSDLSDADNDSHEVTSTTICSSVTLVNINMHTQKNIHILLN